MTAASSTSLVATLSEKKRKEPPTAPAQEDRERSAKLRRENTKLTEENVRLKATVDGALCDTCRGSGKLKHPSPEVQRLRLENALIKQQVETISAVISRHQIGQRAKRQPPSIEYQFLSPRPSRSPVGMAAAAAGESDGGDQMSLQGEVKAPQQKKATELNNKE
ncbi:unnamed protein product [Spirodela intermedia]|uniref:Uncharacterized protein n=2 Tax=Spirodela intermedia TaxID=51605 RepID=A0A7I8IHK8_SPIIN|nr:unnamed protein product [Spirodela intermedia]CAA6657206.1 unnamed protein product [Spirodela intermedia]CAA7393228.1 unnamed protein product [Spirodela intermedia]